MCICEEICYFGDECCCGDGECEATKFECVNFKWTESMTTGVCDADGVDDAKECSMTCGEENCDSECLRRRCGPLKKGPPGGTPKKHCPHEPPKVGGECVSEEICFFGDECCCGEGECETSQVFACVAGEWKVKQTPYVCNVGENECSMTCEEQGTDCNGECLRPPCGPPSEDM